MGLLTRDSLLQPCNPFSPIIVFPLKLFITLQEFNELPTIEKATYIWEQDSFTDSYNIGPIRALLYLVDDFYVEVHYHKDVNKIMLMSIFEDTDCLQPYLKDVDINA